MDNDLSIDFKMGMIKSAVYDMSYDEIDLSNDDIIDIGVDLLYMVVFSIYDDSIKADLHFDGLSDAKIKSYLDKSKKDADSIKESLTGFIGDADKTAAFIKFTLNKISVGGGLNG